MAQQVIIQRPRAGRPEIDLAYQNKIWEFMVDFNLERKPTEVYKRILEWTEAKQAKQASLPRFFREEKWGDPPSPKTVQRYVERFRDCPPMSSIKRKRFQYPDDMEHLGWEHSRTALDCLRFYLSKYEVRPPVGLVQWFCRMAIARQSDLSDSNHVDTELHQIGVYAEVCWFRDLVAAMGKPVPVATNLELALAWKKWNRDTDVPSYEAVAERHETSPDAPLVGIQKEHMRLVTEMPIFMTTFEKAADASHQEDQEERNDA